jgi:hypothetical protein
VGGLSFLAPLYWLGALAIAVPILLHLFRRRTETVVDFPAMRLIVSSPVEQRRRRRLREIILLALRITALVLLAFAFARPYLVGSRVSAEAGVTVVAVDTSYSLGAPGMFDQVRRLAADAVSSAPPGDAVALVTFGDDATTVVPPTTDRSAVSAALTGLQPGPSGTRFTTAVARAAELIGAHRGRLVIVTDRQRRGWDAQAEGGVPDDIEVSAMGVEGPAENLAVTSADRFDIRVVASVHNYGATERAVDVTFAVEGRPAGVKRVTLPARGSADVAFEDGIPRTGAAEVRVADAGGYVADNVRYLVLDPPEATKIAVVVADPSGLRGGIYVERALAAAEHGRAFAATILDGRTLSTWRPEDLRAYPAVAVLGTRTLERRGREIISGYLNEGGAMLLSLGPDVDPGTLADVAGVDLGVDATVVTVEGTASTLIVTDTRHPVFRPFAEPASALGDVAIQRYRPVRARPGRAVLAHFSGGAPALLEEPVGGGRLLMFTSDLDNQWNRLPLSPAFVPFAVEAMRYLTADRRSVQAWVLPSTPPGRAPVPGVFELNGVGAPGSERPPIGEGNSGQPSRRVAINVDVAESDPSTMGAEEFVAAVPRAARSAAAPAEANARGIEDEQRLWQIGLLVMLLALAGEGFIGRTGN